MKLRLIAAAILTASLFPWITPSASTRREADGGKSPMKPMVDLKLQDLKGKTVDVHDLKGKILVVDFWATWCGPCVMEIPEFNQLQKEFAGKGVEVLGVTMASGELADVKPFVKQHNMQYPIFLGDDDQTYDLNIAGYPTTYLVTKDWKVYNVYVGAGPGKHKQIVGDIEKLLKADTSS
ncbi:MAG TPA: TlpA disulfide reductase family protein [Blastocatellia bacterium]|nr:TlpA disulfide reductase family protein [Blastocatellia bacterium]